MTDLHSPRPDDAGLPRSADAWFARLRGTPSAADRAAFEVWRADADNARAYDRLVRTWDQSKFLAHTSVGRARDLSRVRRHAWSARRVVAAGAFLMLCLAGLATLGARWRLGAPGTLAATAIASDAGSVRTIVLPDGSRVTLDRRSEVRIAFDGGERHLRLTSGRARFEVAHDPARPFTVDAGDGSVVAHGTIFDVAFDGNDVQVVLLRGAVEVRKHRAVQAGGAGGVRHLVPGQAIRVGPGPLPPPVKASGLDLQWPGTMIAFDNASLGDAVAAFSRTSPRPVRLDGAALARHRLTGAFRRDDPNGFAGTVAATFGLTRRDDPDRGVTLTSAPPSSLRKKP